ncbi:hypothetical protein G6O69_39115 [Pseudenhygromyxa sp. WMMC2535]|uniref:hypothetical protein n=1 Tax=Pseudenhygromyxa sp. WMMC2535 TaxID=2712867 RepID=UPI001555AB4C|nr:hypothetical protein [Pseudenhygromyxa sp. WMMC2535]NVB38435.1 hypothetical protein [Pseudenhygromyxa sp. WMMC2535]NVB43865.1 hypothetical protein [Pseudenhygromyxa sp. WMMC2535]NVB43867.1 hypothetical protein [Pseudenhygromyxa sp. WMMC2535]NVB43870.1 hypothetical protein [Pseudenhygromyxa sp. WMMC2535]
MKLSTMVIIAALSTSALGCLAEAPELEPDVDLYQPLTEPIFVGDLMIRPAQDDDDLPALASSAPSDMDELDAASAGQGYCLVTLNYCSIPGSDDGSCTATGCEVYQALEECIALYCESCFDLC